MPSAGDDEIEPSPEPTREPGPYDPVGIGDAVKLDRALAELGNRYDRRLPRAGDGWNPLRPGHLGDAAYDGMVDRIYADLTAEPNPEIPDHWWRASRSVRDDVWRVVRKAMLDERLRDLASSSTRTASTEEVA